MWAPWFSPLRFAGSLAALGHRSFRLLWVGLLLSFTGGFMQNAALLWHVATVAPADQKGLALGVIGIVRFVPIVALSLVAGVAADRWDRRRLMLVTQAGSAIVALALAGVTFAGVASLSSLYVLAALGAAIGSFDLPARQSIVPLLVPRDHLSSAISLNAIMIQTASIAGPAAAGFLIVSSGLAAVYLLNALSYGFVILAILRIRGMEQHARGGSRRAALSVSSIGEGLRFVFGSPIVRATMLLDFFATFFSSARTLLPIFAEDVLGVGPEAYGWLYAAPAVGGLAMAAAMVVVTPRIERRGPALLWALTLYGAATIGFGTSGSFWLMFSCLALTGAAEAVSIVIRNVVRQLETPDHLRGRMSAINMVFFQGGPRLGELEAGATAQWLGAPLSVVAGGIGCLVATGWIAFATPELRAYRAASRDRAPSHTPRHPPR